MFCITLIHKSGGHKSCTEKTLRECREASAKIIDKIKGNYVMSTIPYAVYKSKGWLNVYDTTVPFEIKKEIGLEMRMLLANKED